MNRVIRTNGVRGALGAALFVVLALAALVGVRPLVRSVSLCRATAVAMVHARTTAEITAGPTDPPTIEVGQPPAGRRADALGGPWPWSPDASGPAALDDTAVVVVLDEAKNVALTPHAVPRTRVLVRSQRSRAPPLG